MNQYIADYLRLSLDDPYDEDDKGFSESNSISSQRQITLDYISSVPELAGMQVKEFIDDGYTGTNLVEVT